MHMKAIALTSEDGPIGERLREFMRLKEVYQPRIEWLSDAKKKLQAEIRGKADELEKDVLALARSRGLLEHFSEGNQRLYFDPDIGVLFVVDRCVHL